MVKDNKNDENSRNSVIKSLEKSRLFLYGIELIVQIVRYNLKYGEFQ